MDRGWRKKVESKHRKEAERIEGEEKSILDYMIVQKDEHSRTRRG